MTAELLEKEMLSSKDSFLFACGVHSIETTDHEQAVKHLVEQHGMDRARAERAI